ncbi:MAG: hypothetical protein EB098_12000 [Betaproteobacteria bacterium]|nr:hypothetical protein [Betaproteobacteria bacterium]
MAIRMWKALQAKVSKALFGDADKASRAESLPPPLPQDFDLAAYREFMCAETHLYGEDYIRSRVQLQGQAHYEAALKKGSVVVVFVHHGSWLLMNGALHHLCGGAPITSIASRRNLEFCTPEEKEFWLGVHKRSAESCNAPVIFYTDQNPIASVRWLKQPHHVLTVALDVREPADSIHWKPSHSKLWIALARTCSARRSSSSMIC